MKKIAALFALVALSGTAHAVDQLVPANQNYQSLYGAYNMVAPTSTPSPATSPELYGGHASASVLVSQTGTLTDLACGTLGFVLQGSGGGVECALLAGTSVTGTPNTIAYFGSGGLLGSITPDGTTVVVSGTTLERGALTGAITAGAGSTTTAFGTAGALTVLANATSATAVPTFVGPATSGQFFQALSSSSLGWGLVPTTSLSGILQAAQAPAYTGAITTSAGSLTTAFGAGTGFSLLGVTGASGNWAAITPTNTTPVSLPQAPLYNGSSSVAWSPLTATNLNLTAPWLTAGVRVFALDGVNGLDTNQCWADSVDRTQANVSAAEAAAGARACKTLSGLVAQAPTVGEGKVALIFVRGSVGGAATTYTDNPSLIATSLTGYSVVYLVGTGDVATANAVAFSGSTADNLAVGEVVATGFSASGYNPTTSGTSDTIGLAVVGGGSPSFPAEPAAPDAYRFRCAFNTATTALQNKVFGIVQVLNSTTIRIDQSVTFSTSDVCYIEQPGAVWSTTSQVLLGGAVTYGMFGQKLSGSLSVVGGAEAFLAAVQGTNASVSNGGELFLVNINLAPPDGAVGPSMFSGFVSASSAGAVEAIAFTNPPGMSVGIYGTFSTNSSATLFEFGSFNLVGGNATLSGTAGILDQTNNGGGSGTGNFGGDAFNGGTPYGGGNPDRSVRVLGELILDGFRGSIGSVRLPSTSQACGVVAIGANDVVFQGPIQGGLKTDAGFCLQASIASRWVEAATDVSTITGSNSDYDLGWNDYTGGSSSIPILTSYAGVGNNGYGGPVLLPNGDTWIQALPATSAQGTYTSAIAFVETTACHNDSGADIPTGSVVHLIGPHGDHAECAIAQGDSFGDAYGEIGVSLGKIFNNKAGVVAVRGVTAITYSDVVGGAPGSGGMPLYLSSSVAGEVQRTPPTSPNVVRQVGWSNTENALVLGADNWIIGGGLQVAGTITSPIAATGGILQLPTLVTAGSCTNCSLTYDQYGRLTAASSGSGVGFTATLPLVLTGSVLSLQFDNSTITLSGGNALQRGHISGDVDVPNGSNTSTIQPNVVTNGDIRQSGALAVIGRSVNSTGNVADIQATAGSNGVFRESGNVIGFGNIVEASVTNLVSDLAGKQPVGNYITALSGDGTAAGPGSVTFTLNNIPNATTAAGDINFTPIAAPSTPASGHADFYVDSSSLNMAVKNANGIVNHGVQTISSVSHEWIAAIAGDGSATQSQPAFSDLSGTATLAQLPSIAASTLLGNPTASTAAPQAVTVGAGLSYPTSGTTLDLAATGLSGTFGGSNSFISTITLNSYGSISSLSSTGWPAATELLVSTSGAPTGDSQLTYSTSTHTLTVAGTLAVTSNVRSTNAPAYFDTSGDLLSNSLGIVNLYYQESINWSSTLTGGLPFASDTTGALGVNMPETPIGYAASQAKLTCNLASNTITSGGISLRLTRNGSLVNTFFIYNSLSTGGVTSATITGLGGGAGDTYALNYSANGSAGPSGGGTQFSCQLAFN